VSPSTVLEKVIAPFFLEKDFMILGSPDNLICPWKLPDFNLRIEAI
jgi:hypothetical protein